MKYYLLSDVSELRNDKININKVTLENYISTENMLPDKKGVVIAESLPAIKNVPAYEENDILLSNIRPYFKKNLVCKSQGGCSTDVLVLRGRNNINKKFYIMFFLIKAFLIMQQLLLKVQKCLEELKQLS